MNWKIPIAAVVACLFLWVGCSKPGAKDANEDGIITVSSEDAEMNAAIAKARETLPQFWQVFAKPERRERDFALKVKITDGSQAEHFWVVDLERRDGKIMGTINNDPEMVKNVKLGDRITIPEADISDWLYMRADGKMVGNRTIRPLFKQMSAKEVAQFKEMLANP